jgi:hypothetical protein
MSNEVPESYQPGELFASAAPFYARHRPGYPREVFDALRARLGLDGSTPALLGDRAGEFAADVRAAVLALYPAGTVVEPLRTELLIARRL